MAAAVTTVVSKVTPTIDPAVMDVAAGQGSGEAERTRRYSDAIRLNL